MIDRNLSLMKKIGIFILVAAISCGVALLLDMSRVNHLLAIKAPVSKSSQANLGRKTSALAQTITPDKNPIVEVPKQFQGTTIYQAQLKPTEKVISLTFDDGPGPKNTAQVLEILKQNNIKATFFMIGEMVKIYPKIAKQVAEDGHVIGNHTWHHWYRNMDTITAASEINRTADIIYKTTGVKTTLFRPPGGFLHNGLVDYAKSQNYAVMMWSNQSGDAERHSPQASGQVKNVLKGAKPGSIVLMHDGGGNRARTVQALPQIIAGLKSQGYRFVTIPELLEIQAQEKPLARENSPAVTKDKH
ncbi:polysaccharide deacetylase family protein [Calothrix sp. PCC 7507]|uniref:polysaccharide deacetylase family protein n=1 Tax=Calothrix sp. PCC 7507 TaxID=99598 RepID=UPI00029ED91F|nr:polysaccharide deacetylase family protein [Calothrix sp. PCC 7507]AFY34274.1 polysaccharide deacetylase [Calothrix sp. PCC 7507]